MAIAIAAVVGGIGQVAVQWPALRREGFRYRFLIDLRDPGLRRVLLLMGPGTMGLAATQVNLFVSTLLATRQGTGAVSWLQYAFRLMYLPIGLFGVSIATAVLPAAARHAATDDRGVDPRHGVARARADAARQHPRHCRADRAGAPDRPAAVRARALPGGRHGRDGGALRRVRRRPGRLFGGPHRVAGLLRARPEPGARGAEQRCDRRQHRAEPRPGAHCSDSAASRSPRRSPRWRTAPCAVFLLRRQLGGLDTRRLAATVGKVTLASAAMTLAVVTVNRALYDIRVRRIGLDPRPDPSVAAIAAGVVALVLAARVLRIEPFDDAAGTGRSAGTEVAQPLSKGRVTTVIRSEAVNAPRPIHHTRRRSPSARAAVHGAQGDHRRERSAVSRTALHRSVQLGLT